MFPSFDIGCISDGVTFIIGSRDSGKTQLVKHILDYKNKYNYGLPITIYIEPHNDECHFNNLMCRSHFTFDTFDKTPNINIINIDVIKNENFDFIKNTLPEIIIFDDVFLTQIPFDSASAMYNLIKSAKLCNKIVIFCTQYPCECISTISEFVDNVIYLKPQLMNTHRIIYDFFGNNIGSYDNFLQCAKLIPNTQHNVAGCDEDGRIFNGLCICNGMELRTLF